MSPYTHTAAAVGGTLDWLRQEVRPSETGAVACRCGMAVQLCHRDGDAAQMDPLACRAELAGPGEAHKPPGEAHKPACGVQLMRRKQLTCRMPVVAFAELSTALMWQAGPLLTWHACLAHPAQVLAFTELSTALMGVRLGTGKGTHLSGVKAQRRLPRVPAPEWTCRSNITRRRGQGTAAAAAAAPQTCAGTDLLLASPVPPSA